MSEWPPRLHMATLTPAEHAKFLRGLCELTGRMSKDWDNIEQILAQYLTDAYKGGVAAGMERAARICEARVEEIGLTGFPHYRSRNASECAAAIRAADKER